MLKRKITKEEAFSLAEELGITSFIDISNLIDNLHIEQNKETKVCLITPDKNVVEHIFAENFNLPININDDNVISIFIEYGEERFSASTDYGEVYINKDEFVWFLNKEQKFKKCSLHAKCEMLKNITLRIIYVPEYNKIDLDSWRYTLLEMDKLIIVLSANHILYANEKEFIKSMVIPYFSESRLVFAIGNAQQIKSTEWEDAIMRIKIQLGEKYNAIPIFTGMVSEQKRQRYTGYEYSLDSILYEIQKDVLNLRLFHHKDLESYKEHLFESELQKYRNDIKLKIESSTSKSLLTKENEEVIIKSKKHIEDSVNLFLETPLLAKARHSINEFTKLFKESIKEDISESKNIREDAKSMTRYLSFIWEQFVEAQNNILYKEFEQETAMLIDMMHIELRHITHNIQDIGIQDVIKQKMKSAYSVNTFFSRKTSAGNDLTDALTIGGIISGLLISPVGFVAIAASEIIKVTNKDSIDNKYKEELKDKVEETIEENKETILRQAEQRFKLVSKDFHDEIIKYYDEIIKSFKVIINEENEKIAKATEILEKINSVI